jgi:hypothetical protein
MVSYESTNITMPHYGSFFRQSLWPGLLVWCILYVCDYYLTLVCARMYRRGACQKIVLEGSYEITPYFQSDIDSLNFFSVRFLGALLWSVMLLAMTWWFSQQSTNDFYQAILGALICTELAIHVRHFRNLFLFRAARDSDAISGRIEYSRHLMLRMSAIELFTFAAFYFVIFAFTSSWFVLGGSINCLVTGGKHLKLARKPNPSVPPKVPPVAVEA